MIDRRSFLALSAMGAAAGIAGCTSRAAQPPASPDAAAAAVNVAFEPAETEIDLGGVTVRTWAYDGQVPGREVRIRKGERLRADVKNKLPADTSIHWHGIAIVNDMDGVPPLTQQPIPTQKTFAYDFVVPDAGTYWYHSHVGTQLDRGLYGPLIIDDPSDTTDYDDELVVVLDDWIDGTGMNPDQVLENLRKTGMKPMAPGSPGVTPTSPLGEDGGDVTYPYFLINGRVPTDPQVVDYRAGQRIRLRVINAGSDTAFRVAVPRATMYVIQTDGYPVVPAPATSVILHPFHLHGHTFQVMRGDAPRARKDTVLVPPKQTVEVEFDTDNPGKWITHCHNTYHLEAGMAMFIEYAD
jgi:multicopper oxidase